MAGRRLAAAAILAAAAAGCDAPVVTIRHRLPADVPLAGRSFLVEDFAAVGDADADDGRRLARRVVEALSDGGYFSAAVAGQSAGDARDGRIGGTVEIVFREQRGRRDVRVWDGQAKQVTSRPVATLSRSCDAVATFLVRSPAGAAPVRIETRASYHSAADARARGADGLGRGDAPERIGPRSEIVAGLLAVCAERFARMIQPGELTATARMRPTGDRDGAAGIAAVEAGDYAAAVGHFAAAVKRRPDNVDLLFDLAVAEEAAGSVEAARGRYEKVLALRPKDRQAQAALKRAAALAAHSRYEKQLSAPASQGR